MSRRANRETEIDPVASVRDGFEETFLRQPLERQISKCDVYELAPLLGQWLPDHQPILEAGCGSGRWVGWFSRCGWEAVGLDWSEALCARARETIPGARFESGDMRGMPFADEEFGAVVALGSIEHAIEGPERALREIFRVLRPDGIGIITVPFHGPIRRITRYLGKPVQRAKAIPWLRRMFRKPGWRGRSLEEARNEASAEKQWAPVYRCNKGGWHFYEYQFTKSQMRSFIQQAGFQIIEESVAIGDEGVLQSFGRIAGRFDPSSGRVRFSPIGKVLHLLLPDRYVGHMLCYIVRRD